MTFGEKCALSCYTQIAALNEQHNVYIVQHSKTRNIYVKKILTVYNSEVYEYLKNNHIAGVPEIVETAEDGGRLIVIEEYVSGETLQTLLDTGSSFTPGQTADIIRRLCVTVRNLHNAAPPIVHRDIKPSNIIITPDGEVKLVDLNAAKYCREESARDTELLGTVGYAAPEQYGFGTSGVQTDIYSIGVLLKELMGTSAGKEERGMLEAAAEKCTMMDPKDRYQRVDELIEELDAFISSGTGKGPSGSYKRFLPPGFRTGNSMHMAAAVIGYALIFMIGSSMTVKTDSAAVLRFEHIMAVICGLSTVFFTFDYLDVWKAVRIDRIKNRFLKTAAVILADAAILFILFAIMLIAEKAM